MLHFQVSINSALNFRLNLLKPFWVPHTYTETTTPMAALKLLLSQARRHCLTNHPSYFQSALFLGFQRSLCSSSSSSSQPDESESNPPPPDRPGRPSQPVSIQPVSYPVKPKEPSPSDGIESSEAQSLNQSPAPPPPRHPLGPTLATDSAESRRVWSREDIRYVKDAPSISPVSYPLRVAPLPEDKATAAEGGKDEGAKENEEIEKETRRRIEADDPLKRRIMRAAEEERVRVPFPTLIKVKQKEKPPIFDLTEAIRQVKVR